MASSNEIILPEVSKKKYPTTQEYAYARLHQALMVGSIAPGEQITIRGLSEMMAISPTPVREALRRLSSKNALAVRENRRICVPEMTRSRFHELVRLRIAIETHAAERAVPHISNLMIDDIEEIDFEMDKAVIRQDRQRLIILNQNFHSNIYRANTNQVCLPMIESIWLQLGPFMQIALKHIGSFYKVDRHKEIIAALRGRNLPALQRAIHADIFDAVGRFDSNALEKILGTNSKN